MAELEAVTSLTTVGLLFGFEDEEEEEAVAEAEDVLVVMMDVELGLAVGFCISFMLEPVD